MNEEVMKSLVSLIDETLAEVEELKKSDRFSASEIKIEGPGKGIGGQDPDGKLGKEEAEKGEDDKEDDDKEDKKDDDKDMDKAEGKNSEADPNAGHHQPVAKEEECDKAEGDDKEDKKDDDKDMDKAEGKNSEADPNAGHHQPVAKDETGYGKDMVGKMEKSLQENHDLIKSYVDEQIKPINENLEKMMNLIKEIADTPVPSKGASYKDATPLKKSVDEGDETLSKGQVVEKLFELKKSGQDVNTLDITSAELGNPAELAKIVDKYKL